ncbi:DUF3857 domain-containing protein [uncultured Sphingomonas sp.]|uniref:DUF3857 domain-containing protein n=1 Tax=uncultured Sphingomonas sp. TaxID=158754 RepID=UPI00374A8438
MRWWTTAAVCALAAGTASASETPLYQPAPDWVKPAPPITPAQLTAAAPVMVLLDTQQRLKDGQVWRYVDTATRVASPEMMTQAGMLAIPWQPDQGDIIVHRVEIIRGAEHIDLLAGGKRFTVLRRETGLEQREINGVMTANLPIEGLRIGDVVHTTISITQTDKALKGQMQAQAGLVVAPQRAGYARTRFLWPADAAVRWKVQAEGATPVETGTGAMRELVIEGALPKQPDMPGDMPARFVHPAFVEVTSFADWAAVARTMAPLYATDGLIAPGSPLAAEVKRIEAAEREPVKRAALALALVQEQIRYLYNGMAGGNYTPQTPAETWTLRYGDCKAKTLLLLALLHAMDIEAEPVLAPAQAGDVFTGRLPSAGAFDHVLVRTTIGGEVLWLDGTMNGTKLADLRDVPAFRTVLPLRAAGATLMPVPFRAPTRPDGDMTVVLDNRAGVTLPTLATVTMKMRGSAGATIGLIATQATPEQAREMAQGALTPILGELWVVDQSMGFDAATGVGTLTATAIISTQWKEERGRRRRLSLDRTLDDLAFTPDRARPAWRAIPVALGQPTRTLLHLRVQLPGDGKGFDVEGARSFDAPLAGRTVTRIVAQSGATISVDDDVALIEPEIAVDAIPAARARVALARTRKLEAAAPSPLRAHVAEVMIARQGDRLKPLEAAYAKAIAAEPTEAGAYQNRANFRIGIYDYAGAIPDLSKAIEIEPDADLHLRRAQAYAVTGDAKRQRADLDEALALSPDAAGPTMQMARFMLDHGEKDAALAMLDERIAAGGSEVPNYLSEKANLQALAGDGAGAVATMDAAIAANPGNAQLLNSRCWAKGTMRIQLDSALKDCTQAIESGARLAALDSRAMVYFRLDRLDAALTDLDAALEEEPDLSSSLFLRGVIRNRQGKKAEAAADLLAARTIWPLIDRDYAAWGIKP